MAVNICFINTITGVEKMFNSLCIELINKEFTTSHISDETIIKSILKHGGLTKYAARRICAHAAAAEESGADIIQFTCSSVTPVIESASSLIDIPVLSVDAPMALAAVSGYAKIGVTATNPGTLTPSTDLLVKTAEKLGRKVDITAQLCEGAYDALFKGDTETHDRIVLENLKKLSDNCDVIVLAQASMSRVAELIPEEDRRIPVFSSPRPAITELANRIEKL